MALFYQYMYRTLLHIMAEIIESGKCGFTDEVDCTTAAAAKANANASSYLRW